MKWSVEAGAAFSQLCESLIASCMWGVLSLEDRGTSLDGSKSHSTIRNCWFSFCASHACTPGALWRIICLLTDIHNIRWKRYMAANWQLLKTLAYCDCIWLHMNEDFLKSPPVHSSSHLIAPNWVRWKWKRNAWPHDLTCLSAFKETY